MISRGHPKGAFWLAIASAVCLLPTALIRAWLVIAWWADAVVEILWPLLSLMLTLLILTGALVVLRGTPRLGLWGGIILASAFLQLIAAISPGYGALVLWGWLPQEVQLPLLILGVILGTVSGIWLIVKHRGAARRSRKLRSIINK
jgi:hypothetical protein